MKKILSLALFLLPFQSFSVTEQEQKETKDIETKPKIRHVFAAMQFQINPNELTDKEIENLKKVEFIPVDYEKFVSNKSDFQRQRPMSNLLRSKY